MNALPLNGRVVIVDDQIEQALPIMNELGKRGIAYTYYNGDMENLPEEGTHNDIRLLFLDINLIDNAVHDIKKLYPKIYAVINRIIGKNSFPYVLVCWSRNEEEYDAIVRKLNDDFEKRKPICSIQLNKSDFFSMTGKKTDDFDEKIESLFNDISSKIEIHVNFSNILKWENHVHTATSGALNECLSCIDSDWDKMANWIFTKWSIAYSGKNFDNLTQPEKLKSAFHTLNQILFESIEEEVSRNVSQNSEFITDTNTNDDLLLNKFNEHLLFSYVETKPKEPGRVVITKEDYSDFNESLCFAINRQAEVPEDIYKGCSNEKDKAKARDRFFKKEVRDKIRESWDLFKLVINPVCDFAQNKIKVSRTIPGIFINATFYKYINKSSDAIFVSPKFYHSGKKSEYFFILDFRYFSSEKNDEGESSTKLKQLVLAEVLSKLSRHINRQGILFVE